MKLHEKVLGIITTVINVVAFIWIVLLVLLFVNFTFGFSDMYPVDTSGIIFVTFEIVALIILVFCSYYYIMLFKKNSEKKSQTKFRFLLALNWLIIAATVYLTYFAK